MSLLSFKYFCNTYLGYITGYSPVSAGYIQSCVAFRPIVYERKYLMDYNESYWDMEEDRSAKGTDWLITVCNRFVATTAVQCRYPVHFCRFGNYKMSVKACFFLFFLFSDCKDLQNRNKKSFQVNSKKKGKLDCFCHCNTCICCRSKSTVFVS